MAADTVGEAEDHVLHSRAVPTASAVDYCLSIQPEQNGNSSLVERALNEVALGQTLVEGSGTAIPEA